MPVDSLEPALAGVGDHLRRVEAEVVRDGSLEALQLRGVFAEQVELVLLSTDRALDAAQRVARIMRANGMKSCVAVSDGYHIFRAKRILENEGMTVFGAPRPQQEIAESIPLENIVLG